MYISVVSALSTAIMSHTITHSYTCMQRKSKCVKLYPISLKSTHITEYMSIQQTGAFKSRK